MNPFKRSLLYSRNHLGRTQDPASPPGYAQLRDPLVILVDSYRIHSSGLCCNFNLFGLADSTYEFCTGPPEVFRCFTYAHQFGYVLIIYRYI